MNKKQIADSLLQLADSIESGESQNKVTIAVTNFGSELGAENVNEAIRAAQSPSRKLIVVGSPVEGFESYEAEGDQNVADVLQKLFREKTIDAAVTMHYPFPIGVSTVGKIITPAKGKEMYIATTTGTTDTKREKAMVLNAINGIACAKANGIENPTVGILNVEAARIVEKKLKALQEGGFPIEFAESARADGGCVMRGNDVILGTPDVMVCDSLTGNVLTKLFAGYTSGGTYETTGYGYGPSLGEGHDQPVLIISRASGAPLIKNAIAYAESSVRGSILKVQDQLYKQAHEAGLDDLLADDEESCQPQEKVEAPPKEIVTGAVPGIDILDIDNAVQCLWKEGIYAESAMGCTGPIIQVSEANLERAKTLLHEGGYIDE